jgi:hypothetical protein
MYVKRVVASAQKGQLKTRSELGFGRVSSFLQAGVSLGSVSSPSEPQLHTFMMMD